MHLIVEFKLTDNFFSQSYEQKTEIVLHELGHFLTNPILIKIRNYIANKNPSLLSIENADPLTDNLVGRFNESLSFLFQIPKLAQELHAEMWLYDNERDISKNRLRNYCNTLIDAIDEFRAANITSTFIFEIPRINFLLLFRKIVIENTDFDYTNNCLESIEIVYQEYSRLVISANLVHLQIYEKYNEHINCLDYSSLQEEELISTFNDVYDDYIRQAVTFFLPISNKVF